MGIMITYHGYNNGYNNPLYNVHKSTGVRYTQQNMVIVETHENGNEFRLELEKGRMKKQTPIAE